MSLIKIENFENLVKDTRTNAVVNTSKSEFQLYLRQNNIMSDKLRILYHGTEEKNIPSILGANYLLGSKHRLEFGGGWAFGGEEFSNGLYVTIKSGFSSNISMFS